MKRPIISKVALSIGIGLLAFAVTAASIIRLDSTGRVRSPANFWTINSNQIAAALAGASINYDDVSAGTLTLTNALAIESGGTGSTNAEGARAALGVTPSPTTTRGDIIRRGASADERVALGNFGERLLSDGTDPTWLPFSRYTEYSEDFYQPAVSVTAGSTWYYITASGTGGATVLNSETNAIGIHQFHTGATTNVTTVANFGPAIIFGGGIFESDQRIRIPVLSTSTDKFIVRAGFFDNSTGNAVDGCYFQYSHDVNSGRWVLANYNNSSGTTTNSTVAPVAATWTRLKVRVDSVAGTAAFSIDGTLIATLSGIPAGTSRFTFFRLEIEAAGGSTGTGSDLLQADFSNLRSFYTVDRNP